MNESTLGQVPSAARANVATDAVTATSAGRAATATVATHADSATTATSAGRATSAASADRAGSAARADNAAALDGTPASGYARSQLEPLHVVGASGEPNFENGCLNTAETKYERVGFYKDPFGIVHLGGLAVSCSASEGNTFTLPVGFRPEKTVLVAVYDAAPSQEGAVRIEANGEVIHFAPEVGLSGITFRAAS